jgi:dihydroorotate dehydrogenase (fumarate)
MEAIMADLRTTYLGLELAHPLVPSASPLSRNLDDLKRLEDAGAAAVVLYSLFEEQVAIETGEFSDLLQSGKLSPAEVSAYFPQRNEYPRDPEAYVEHLRKAKEALGIPIFASMNGTSKGGWLKYAEMISQAGADGLELNVYFLPASDTFMGMDIENLYLDIVKTVKKSVSIPVAVKLSPFFSALPEFASRLVDAGADGLVLFNRFYQPDIDVKNRSLSPTLSLSNENEILLPLRWIAILSGQISASLALTTGVHSGRNALKAIMAGADIAQVCSVLLARGIPYLRELVQELESEVEQQGVASLSELRGLMSLQEQVEPIAYERASYIKLLQNYGRI